MARAKPRGEKLPQFVPLLHETLACQAWRRLSPVARLVYIALKRQTRPETNGTTHRSIREAAEECGAHRNTIAGAYHELQAHGFLVATAVGHLGVEGKGKATTWRLTELGHAGGRPTKDYLRWSPGNDYPILKPARPSARKQKPGTNGVHACHKDCDVLADPVTEIVTPCHKDCAVSGQYEARPVTGIVPHLYYTREGALSGAAAMRTFAVTRGGALARFGVRSDRRGATA